MNLLAMALLARALAPDQTAHPVPVKWDAIQAVEQTIDSHLAASGGENTVLMENTMGVYLEGWGAVLTAQVNLYQGTGISPFHPQYTPEEKARLRARKLERIGALKDTMRNMLIAAAAGLRAVPLKEKVVLAVSLFYYVWEDRAGLPSQIVMQATREQLVTQQAPDAIKVQEF